VAFHAVQDSTYYLAVVGSTNNGSGNVSLRIRPGPINDDFANATPISGTNILTSIQLFGASHEVGEPVLANASGASVWWKWSPGVAGRYWINASNQNSLNLGIYKGDAVNTLDPVAAAGYNWEIGAARAVINTTVDETYFIKVEDGTFMFTSGVLTIKSVAANDDFAARTLISGTNVVVSVPLTGTTRETNEPNIFGASVWFEWVAPFSGGVGVEGTSLTWAPSPVVYTGTTFADLVPVSTPLPKPATNQNFGFYPTRVSFRAIAGEKYFIALGGLNDVMETGTLTIKLGPANDDFENAPLLTGTNATVSLTLLGATLETGELPASTNSTGVSVWWKFRPERSGPYSFELSSTEISPTIALYHGETLSDLVTIAVDPPPDQTWGTGVARANLWVATNETVVIRAAGGLGRVILKIRPGPGNDDFNNAFLIANLTFSGTTLGATPESDEPLVLSSKGSTVWYKWIPAETAGYQVRLTNPSGVVEYSEGSRLTVFRRSVLTNLAKWGAVESFYEQPSSNTFGLNANEEYYLQVDGKTTGGGGFIISIKKAVSNDNFDTRFQIALDIPLGTTTVGSTREPGEPNQDGTFPARTLWWEFQAPSNGGYYLTSPNFPLGSGFAVYQGSALGNLLSVPIMVGPARKYSTFRATAGQTYFICLYDQSAGNNFSFVLSHSPPGDDWPGAFYSGRVSGNNFGATRQPDEPPSKGSGATVWYSFTVNNPGNYAVQSRPGIVSLYKGSSLNDLSPIEYRQDTQSLSTLCFRAEGGLIYYYLSVDSYDPGAFDFSIVPTTTNDEFANRAVLKENATVQSFLATREPGEPVHSTNFYVNTLWWRWIPAISGGYRFYVPNPLGKAVLAIYTGPDLLHLIPAAIQESATGSLYMNMYAVAGTEYAIAFGESIEGQPLDLTVSPSPANDDFEQATVLQTGISITNIFSGATVQPGEPLFWPERGTVWYKWTALESGTFTLNVTPEAYYPLGVFRGTSLDALELVNKIDQWSGGPGHISVRAEAGTTYWFVIGLNSSQVPVTKVVSVTPGAANDDFANATELSGSIVQWVANTYGATVEPGETVPSGENNRATVWAKWIAPDTGVFRLRHSSASISLAVFEGAFGNLKDISQTNRLFHSFSAQAGRTYYFRVDTAANALNFYPLRLGPEQPNDEATGAVLIDGTKAIVNVSTWTATPSTGTLYDDLWWKWKAPADGLLRLTATNIVLPNPPLIDVFHSRRPTIYSNVTTMLPSRGQTGNYWISNQIAVVQGLEYRLTIAASAMSNMTLHLDFVEQSALAPIWEQTIPGLLRGGTELWKSETDEVKTGPEALKLTIQGSAAEGWLEGIYPGPGTLQFWFKTSGKLGYTFYILTNQLIRVQNPGTTGSTNWTFATISLTKATNVVRWLYTGAARDFPAISASAWLDGITYTPKAPRPPVFSALTLTTNKEVAFYFYPELQRTYTFDYSTNLTDWTPWTNFFSVTSFYRFTVPTETNGILFLRSYVR
jgi:hypothetical protein